MGKDEHEVHGREVVLDVLTRRGLGAAFAVVALVYGVSWAIGLHAPPMKTVSAYDAYRCAAPAGRPVVQGGSELHGAALQTALKAEKPCAGGVDMSAGAAFEDTISFGMRFDQFFFLHARIQNTAPDAGREVRLSAHVELWRRGAAGPGGGGGANASGAAAGWEAVGSAASHDRTKTLVCRLGEPLCEPVLLAKQTSVQRHTYRLKLALRGGGGGAGGALGGVGNVVLQFVSKSAAFVLYEGAFKYVFLCVSLCAVALYGRRYLALPHAERMLEQRWVWALLLGTPALDDAPYALLLLRPGLGSKLLSAVLQSTFLALLLLFWLVTLGAIRSPPTRIGWARFALPKYCLLGCFWLATTGANAWAAWSATFEPSAYAQLSPHSAPALARAALGAGGAELPPAALLQLIAHALAGVYCVWLLAVLGRTLPEVFTMPAHFCTSFFFTAAVLVCTLVGVVVGALSPVHDEAAEFLSFLTLFNLYVWLMAYFYAPTLNATRTVTASRSALLHDPAKFSIDDEEGEAEAEGLMAGRHSITPERHDPSKFAI